jgi:hypothetical protein
LGRIDTRLTGEPVTMAPDISNFLPWGKARQMPRDIQEKSV